VIWSFLFGPISVARLIVARLVSENQMRAIWQSFRRTASKGKMGMPQSHPDQVGAGATRKP